MASSAGQVTLRGRFSPGDVVTLVKVDGAHVLRSEGGEEIDTKTVGEEKDAPRVGYVRFSGVEVGARYFVRGLTDGRPLEVRVTGRAKGDPSEVFEQAPVLPDRTRFSDGSFVDSAPTKESAPHILAGNADIRHVKKGTVLRSDTPRGEAHPLDPKEKAPKRSQEDVKKGAVQMSDTRRRETDDGNVVGGGGEATELVLGPQRQEDVPKGVVQRSSTPTGVAQPIPSGDAVQQAMDRESSFAKETRGEPVRAAAEPIDAPKTKAGPPSGSTQKQSEERDRDLKKSEREAALLSAPLDQPGDNLLDTSGYDAQGQPAAPDVARASGVEPAAKPRIGDASKRSDRAKSSRSEAGKKAARTRKRNERKAEQEKGTSGTTTGAATTSNTTAKEK